jgi:iron complex transport system substrate-binding protein
MLCALGLRDSLVAVTHECDYPEGVERLPHLTSSVIPEDLTPAEIDVAVREHTGRGEALYELNEPLLHELEPDLIVTQALCAVCAVSVDDVRKVAERLPSGPAVLSLDPGTLGEVLGDVRTLAQAVDAKDAGVDLVQDAAARIDRVRLAVRGADPVRVAALEWLDPVFVGGHWVPQLIEHAGGEDLLGLPGEPSFETTWEHVAAARPQVVVVMPCGYDVARGLAEAERSAPELAALGADRIVVADASAWFSRPGPRLIEGLEWLGHVLHPDRVPEPAAGVRELVLSPR